MPEMNGIELLKILRIRGDLTPFILFSGAEDLGKIARAAASYGSFESLTKNRDIREQISPLVDMIRRAVMYSGKREAVDDMHH